MADLPERKRETIELALVIMPTIGNPNQVDTMYFGYNELKRQGNDQRQLQYLQAKIREKHLELQVFDPASTGQLRSILREWHPEFASPGTFTIQIQGRLTLADPARVASDDAKNERLKEDLVAAQRGVNEAILRAKQEQNAKNKALKELEEQRLKQQQEQARSAADSAALERAEREREELVRQLAEAKVHAGESSVAKEELERAQERAKQQEGQGMLDNAAAAQRIADLTDQIERLKKTAQRSAQPSEQAAASSSGQSGTNEPDSPPIVLPPEGLKD